MKLIEEVEETNLLHHTYEILYNNNLGMNGKYYLWKLYIYEFIENWVQYYNLRQVFLCTMPLECIFVVYFIMILETGGRAFAFGRLLFKSSSDTITIEYRNSQVISDTFVDLFF